MSFSIMPNYLAFIAGEIARFQLCRFLKTYCSAVTLLRTHTDLPAKRKLSNAVQGC